MTGDASGRIQARLPAVLEHRAARDGRLRRNRLKIALAVVLVPVLAAVVTALAVAALVVLAAVALVVLLRDRR